MNLAAYQRTVMRVMMAREPAAEDLQALGEESRWRIYRHMVRTRIEDMARRAFKQTHALVGDATFGAALSSYFELVSPQSGLIREVIAAFGSHFQQSDLLTHAPPSAADMLRFERALWEVAYQQASPPVLGEQGVRELDFDGALVLNPVLRVLSLAFAVQREQAEWNRAQPTHLLVYRTIGAGEIRWWATTPLFAELLSRAQTAPEQSLADAVRNAVLEAGLVLDQALLESLSDDLTLALQRTVVIGVR